MFQTKEYIDRKHGKNGTDRAYYLNQLVSEYKTTKSQEAKQQVLANLANFSYDPINYNTLWDLQVVALFLSKATTDNDALLQEFGMGGLANICLEKRHHEFIMSKESYRDDIVKCLDTTSSINLLVNTMTTLMQLVTADNYTVILTAELRERLLKVRDKQQYKQAVTMAEVFLQDYYHLV